MKKYKPIGRSSKKSIAVTISTKNNNYIKSATENSYADYKKERHYGFQQKATL